MKWIGLTGGMGTGKTTVSGIIQSLGYHVLNADKNAHEALQKTSPVFSRIIQTFGPHILRPDGEIDRKKLGDIVFADKFQLSKLESIVHPQIQELTKRDRQKLAESGIALAFYDIPLLFEKRLEKSFDKILTISCKRDLQIQRAMQRTGLSEEEIRKRLAAQLPMEVKVRASHYTIRNDGSLEELKIKVQDVLLKIKKDLKLV